MIYVAVEAGHLTTGLPYSVARPKILKASTSVDKKAQVALEHET